MFLHGAAMNVTRKALLWQLGGGVVAACGIFAFVIELIWWPVFLSDRSNVTWQWSVIAHGFAAATVIMFVFYVRAEKDRQRVFAQARVGDAGRFGFDVKLFTFPVHVQYMFLVMALILSVREYSLLRYAMFFLLVIFGVFTHELGHAIVARKTGHFGVRIELNTFGGLTYFSGGTRRAQRAAVTLAGPAVGIAIGIFLLKLATVLPAFHESFVYRDMLFVTLGWSLLNLLPILPLDGGALLASALRNDALAQSLSIGFAVIGIFTAHIRGMEGLTFFFVVLALSNVMTLPKVSSTVARWNRRVG